MKTVFVVGAGPAGLFAAQKIAQAGHQTIIFNRDVKPGGLAEYGIYPTKDKMKFGLRKQFAKVLSLPNVHYFGNVPVSKDAAVTVDDLKKWDPTAIVFAVGAQGTKKLGLPGEKAKGGLRLTTREELLIVFGDCRGRSAEAWVSDEAVAIARRHGFAAGLNDPFAGGHVVERHGAPARGVHALQIELDRRCYLDDSLSAPGEGFDRAASLIEALAVGLGEALLGQRFATAAE